MADEASLAELGVRIRPNTTGFDTELSGKLKPIAAGAAALFGAYQLKEFFAGGLDELKEQQRVVAQTGAVIKSTGSAAGVTADQVSQLAVSLGELSGKDAEAIQGGENLLLTFRSVRNAAGEGNDVFNQATKAALDLSVAWGQDITQSAVLVGKALEDPIAGLTALRRVGITFTEQQRDQIKALVESGRQLEAQKLVLAELEKQVGGSAAAYGETLPGKLERAKNSLDDFKATIVGVAAPAVEDLADKGAGLAKILNTLPAPVTGFAVKFLAANAALAIGAPLLSRIGDRAAALKGAFTGAGGGLSGFLASANKLAKGGVIAVGIAGILTQVQELEQRGKTLGSSFGEGLDVSDIDGFLAKTNEGVARVNQLNDAIANGARDVPQAIGEGYKTAGDILLGVVGQGDRVKDSIVDLQTEVNALSPAVQAAAAKGEDLKARLAEVATASGLSGTQVKELVKQFKGLDITQVPLPKLVEVLTRLQRGELDAAGAAEILGAKVRTAGDDAVDAASSFDKANDALRDLTDAQYGYEDAVDRVTDAERNREKAAERVADAQFDYQRALQGVTDAQRDQTRAREAVTDAESALAKARAEGDPDAIRDAERRLRDAREGEEKAARAVSDAQRAVQKAYEAIVDAQFEAERAAKAVARAQYDAGKAAEDLKKKTQEASTAGDLFNQDLNTMLIRLQGIAALGPEAAAGVQPLIDRIYALNAALLFGEVARSPLVSGFGVLAQGVNATSARQGADRLAGGPAGTGGTTIVNNYNGMTYTDADQLARHGAKQTGKTLTLLGGA